MGTEEESPMDLELDLAVHLGGDKSSTADKSTSFNVTSLNLYPDVDLELGLSNDPTLSDITAVHWSPDAPEICIEGSTSSAFQTGESSGNQHFPNQQTEQRNTISPGLSSSIITMPKRSVTSQLQQRTSSTKQCQIQGCLQGARGASGLCIAHGGGSRCKRPGCLKGAEDRSVFCKAHGGGRRCNFLGCTKSAEWRTDFCIAHGGGRRCNLEGCTRAARGKSGLCIRHGGGRRCQTEDCTRSAEDQSGLCISHGGSR